MKRRQVELGILDNDRLNPWVNWSTLSVPLYKELEHKDDVDVISPPRIRLEYSKDWVDTFSRVNAAKTLFWMQGSVRPKLPIHLASVMNITARRSAFVVDAWKPALDRIGFLATVQRLDPCFVAFREGQQELQRRFKHGKFEWMPFGIDTNTFHGRGESRPIFAFWMGRRYEPLHQALLEYCTKNNLKYIYRQPNVFPSPTELGDLASQSKYFIATPPDLDGPEKTGGFSPLVMRYMEGLAAGARLLGVLPKSGEYEEFLPIEAICQVSPDGSDLARKLGEDADNAVGWQAVGTGQALVRRHHSCARRAEQLYQRLVHGAPVDLDAMKV